MIVRHAKYARDLLRSNMIYVLLIVIEAVVIFSRPSTKDPRKNIDDIRPIRPTRPTITLQSCFLISKQEYLTVEKPHHSPVQDRMSLDVVHDVLLLHQAKSLVTNEGRTPIRLASASLAVRTRVAHRRLRQGRVWGRGSRRPKQQEAFAFSDMLLCSESVPTSIIV